MAHRKLETALEPLGLSAQELLGAVPRRHRKAVADSLVAVARADDMESALTTVLGRAVLEDSLHVQALRKAGLELIALAAVPHPAPPIQTDGFVVSLGLMPPALWAEARANSSQRAEWHDLFGTDDPSADWPVDTRHFPPDVFDQVAEARGDHPGGMAIHRENLSALLALNAGPFRCLYIDPPYNTRASRLAYADSTDDESWLSAIGKRLRAAKVHLHEEAVAWVQVDHNASDDLPALLGRTFGGGVQNRVVWAYGGSGRGAKAVTGRLPRNYDTLYLAAMRSHRFRLNRVTVPFAVPKADAAKIGFRHDGRRWFKTAPRGDYTDESVARLQDEGRIHRTRDGNLRIKYFLREQDGMVIEDRLVGDVWTDIPDMMHAPRDEWTGFASQKPLALLRRVLDLSCRPGDGVLDFYAGTGTTACAALERGLRFCAIESGDHFETILIPRLKRTLARHPGFVEVCR